MTQTCPFRLSQLDIIIKNVEFCLDPENGTLDTDDCEGILEYLKELRVIYDD